MSHRSSEQLAKAETDLMERVKAVRAEIRQRKAKEMTKLAMSYAKAISAAAKASGGEIPSPEQLAAMLAGKPSRKVKAGPKPKPAAKRPRRKLAPPAAPSA